MPHALVTRCVPPGTLCVITASFIVINMNWVVLSAASALGAFLLPHRSMGITFLEEDSVTDFAVLPNSPDETLFRQASGNLSRSPSAGKHARMVFVTLCTQSLQDTECRQRVFDRQVQSRFVSCRTSEWNPACVRAEWCIDQFIFRIICIIPQVAPTILSSTGLVRRVNCYAS